GGTGGGGGGGGSAGGFAIASLDPTARDIDQHAVAFDPVKRRVGVVYYNPRGTQTMTGIDDYDIKYVEWNDPDGDGTGTISPVETIRFVQRKVGLAIAFHPTTGEPVVSYVGGAPGFIMNQSIYWFQSDAVINTRNNGTWTETIVASTGAEVRCGSTVSDRAAIVVGMWPALLYDPTGLLYFAYRDGHDGQFGKQDAEASDVEVWEGTPPPTTGKCVNYAGDNKQGWGGHIKLVAGAEGRPAMIYDQMLEGWDDNGSNVWFHERDAQGNWGAAAPVVTISNTQSGASLAYDAMEGYGVAVVERATNSLLYVRKVPGATRWNVPDAVYNLGTGGWYPSLAIDPVYHEPAIAFYFCSNRNGIAESNCLTTEDELRIRQRIAGTWRETVVDPEGGYLPQLGFFVQGSGPGAVSKRVLVYRQPSAIDPATSLPVTNQGELKIAVER
ncbi:MAG: hypothetical protein AB1938_23735, partial [Myxococcota bacterium]